MLSMFRVIIMVVLYSGGVTGPRCIRHEKRAAPVSAHIEVEWMPIIIIRGFKYLTRLGQQPIHVPVSVQCKLRKIVPICINTIVCVCVM